MHAESHEKESSTMLPRTRRLTHLAPARTCMHAESHAACRVTRSMHAESHEKESNTVLPRTRRLTRPAPARTCMHAYMHSHMSVRAASKPGLLNTWPTQHLAYSTPGRLNTWPTQHLAYSTLGRFRLGICTPQASYLLLLLSQIHATNPTHTPVSTNPDPLYSAKPSPTPFS
eukprot:366236-Chlamydomonas_euryale.AAC.1